MAERKKIREVFTVFIRETKYFLEYLAAETALWLISLMDLKQASDFGAYLFKKIGMKLSATDRARKNLAMIFPEKTEDQREQITSETWENLGRMIGENPIFLKMKEQELEKHFNIINIDNLLKFKGKRALFFTAHMANWEIARRMVDFKGINLHAVYRKVNNPRIEKMISELRGNIGIPMIPKGKYGAKLLIEAIKQEKQIVMLLDQKMNDGIKIDFLGKPAMTASAIASLALKYDCPIIPIQIIRKDKYYFDMIFHPKLELTNKNIEAIMQEINDIIGDWVKQNPGQWLWLHRRWVEEDVS